MAHYTAHPAAETLPPWPLCATIGADEEPMEDRMEFGLTDDRLTMLALALKLDSAGVETLISQLVELRSQMIPPRAQINPFPGTAVMGSPLMRWYVQETPGTDQIGVLLMHPGAGWFGIQLDPEGALAMIAEMLLHSPPAVRERLAKSFQDPAAPHHDIPAVPVAKKRPRQKPKSK